MIDAAGDETNRKEAELAKAFEFYQSAARTKDQEPEIFERQPICQEPVRSNHNIDIAGFEIGNHLFGLRIRQEPAEHFDSNGITSESFTKGL